MTQSLVTNQIPCSYDNTYIKLRFCEIVTVKNSKTRILLMKALYEFRTTEC